MTNEISTTPRNLGLGIGSSGTSGRIATGPDHPGALQVDTNGQVSHTFRGSYQEPIRLDDGTNSVVDSGRTTWGSSRPNGRLGPKDIVVVEGMETSVAVAEHLGYIRRIGDGLYEDIRKGDRQGQSGEGQPSQTQVQKAEADASAPVGLPKETARTHEALTAVVDEGMQGRAIRDIIQSGDIEESTLIRAASELGMDLGEFTGQVAPLVDAMRTKAGEILTASGIPDLDHFVEWASTQQSRQYKDACLSFGMRRDASGLKGLAQSYISDLHRINPGAILDAEFGGGITARQVNGRVVLSIPGRGEVDYAVAVRNRWISVDAG